MEYTVAFHISRENCAKGSKAKNKPFWDKKVLVSWLRRENQCFVKVHSADTEHENGRLTLRVGPPGVYQVDGLGLIVKCIWTRRAQDVFRFLTESWLYNG